MSDDLPNLLPDDPAYRLKAIELLVREGLLSLEMAELLIEFPDVAPPTSHVRVGFK